MYMYNHYYITNPHFVHTYFANAFRFLNQVNVSKLLLTGHLLLDQTDYNHWNQGRKDRTKQKLKKLQKVASRVISDLQNYHVESF